MNRFPLALAMALAAAAVAQEQMQDEPFWGGSVNLGYVSTSGNSDTQTLNFAFDFGKDGPVWRHGLHLEAYNNSSDSERTAEKYLGSWQSNLKFNARQSMFFRGQYEEDKFSSYQNQTTLAIGYGHRLIDDDKVVLDLEAGPGYRRSKLQENGDIEEEGVLRLAGNFKWNISSTAAFGQLLSVEKGRENTVARSSSSLTVSITEALALKLAYNLRWNQHVDAGFDNWDRETTASVVYRW